MKKPSSLYVGLISGTSMDAVDACVVDFDASKPKLVETHAEPVPAELKRALSALTTENEHDALDALGRADVQVAELFARAVKQLLIKARLAAGEIKAIGTHGQTVRHGIAETPPYTLQIGDPNVIAARTGINTVADFRRRDVALGGQGAPLAPAFHHATLASQAQTRAVLNLGGIANLTILPRAGDVTGWDTGPANCLMDAWFRRHRKGSYDKAGTWSAEGRVLESLLTAMAEDDYFLASPPKSTGTETFNLNWLQRFDPDSHEPADVQATLCELTAQTVARSLAASGADVEEVLLCGGGQHNTELVEKLRLRLQPAMVTTTDQHGVPGDWVEAMTFAWLAHRWDQRLPGNLPSVTGASEKAILGGLYPASETY